MAKGVVTFESDVTYQLISTKQVSVTVAPIKISDGGFGISKVQIRNPTTNVNIFISGSSESASTTEAYAIYPGDFELLPYNGEIWGMVQTTTSTVYVLTYMGRTST